MASSTAPFQRDVFSTGMMTSFCTVCRQLVAATFDSAKLYEEEKAHSCDQMRAKVPDPSVSGTAA